MRQAVAEVRRPSAVRQALGLITLGAPLVLAAAALDGGFALFLMAVQAFFPDRLHAGAASPGYALALYGATRVLLQGPGGLLARRLGTRRQIVVGMAGGALALAALATATGAVAAYLLTLLYGVMTALAWPAIFLEAGDLVEDSRGELISYVTLCAMGSMVVCSGIGAFLVDYLPARLVVVSAGVFLSLGTVAVGLLPGLRPAVPSGRTGGRTTTTAAPCARAGRGAPRLFAALLLQGLGLAMLTPLLRQYARQQLQLQLHDLIFLGAPAGLCAAATFVVAGRLTDRVGRAPVVAGGTIVAGLGTAVIAVAHGGALFALGAAPLAIGYAASTPALGAWMTDLNSASGGGVGLALTIQGLALAIGPALTGVIVGARDPGTALRVAAVCWLSAAVFTFKPERDGPRSTVAAGPPARFAPTPGPSGKPRRR